MAHLYNPHTAYRRTLRVVHAPHSTAPRSVPSNEIHQEPEPMKQKNKPAVVIIIRVPDFAPAAARWKRVKKEHLQFGGLNKPSPNVFSKLVKVAFILTAAVVLVGTVIILELLKRHFS